MLKTTKHHLNGPFGLDAGDGRVDVLRGHVAPVQQAAGHVLAVARVALDHLVLRLEAGRGQLRHGHLLVVGLLGADHRRVVDQREVDARVGHQVGLELGEVDVEGAFEAEGGGDGGNYLADQSGS